MTDEELATRLHEAAGQFNHFVHVAKHRGIKVYFDWIDTKGPAPGRISNLLIARPIVPEQMRASEEAPRAEEPT